MSETQSVHYGKAYRLTVSANTTLKLSRGRVVMLNVTSSGLEVKLTKANRLPLNVGGPCFFLCNVGSHAVTIVDQSDNPIGPGAGTIAVDHVGIVVLSENDDATGVWHMKSTAIRGGGDPPATPTPTPTPGATPTPTPPPPTPTPTPSPPGTTVVVA